MGNNLTNQYISSSFKGLVQVSSSLGGEQLTDGTGSLIQYIDVQVASAISSSYAVTASYAENGGGGGSVDTGSLLANASVIDATTTYTRGDGSTFPLTINNVANATSALLAVTASHAVFSEEAENALHADTLQFPVIVKETLTKGDPVYISGYNAGQDLPEVKKADASDPTKMPSIGLVLEDASNNDRVFIINSGDFNNIDTVTGLTAPSTGDTIYVDAGGGFTNVKPTGTNLVQNVGIIGRVNSNNGEVVVSAIGRSNDLPNIPSGEIWAGDANGVPQSVSTGSFAKTDKDNTFTSNNFFTGTSTFSGSILSNTNIDAASFNGDGSGVTGVVSASHAVNADNLGGIGASTYARTDIDNTFTGTQTFDNIAVNGTGSFAYIQSITGSAKIIGDNYIILNNDTPTERYAGVVVQDSGSTATTASFEFDGATDDWFYEYSTDGGVTTDHGVAMFGPEYNTKGSPVYPTNDTILKGNGGHHVLDSNISDDGTTVTINAGTQFNQSGSMTGGILEQSRTTPSNGFVPKNMWELAPTGNGKRYAKKTLTTVGDGIDESYQESIQQFTETSGNLSTTNPGTTFKQTNTEVGFRSYQSGSGAGYYSRLDLINAGGQTRVNIVADTVYGTAYDTYEIDGVNGMKIGNYAGSGGTFGNIDIGHNAGANVTINGNFATNESTDFFGYNNFVHGKLGGRKFYTSTATKEAQDVINDGGNANFDSDSGNIYLLYLPSNANTVINIDSEVGQSCNMVVQSGTNSTVTWPSYFKFPGGTAPTLTNTSGSRDVISWVKFSNDFPDAIATAQYDFS